MGPLVRSTKLINRKAVGAEWADGLRVGPNAVNLTDMPRAFCFFGFPVETVKRGLLSLLQAYAPDACAPNRGSFFDTPADSV